MRVMRVPLHFQGEHEEPSSQGSAQPSQRPGRAHDTHRARRQLGAAVPPWLVDWGRCVVRIDEACANDMLDVLGRIGEDERCRMRRYCCNVYERYMVNPEANVDGMVDSIEVARSRR